GGLAVGDAEERNSEFIAHLPAECPGLHMAKMVRIRWFATADETRLSGDESKVFHVSVPPRRWDRRDALVDTLYWNGFSGFGNYGLFGPGVLADRRPLVWCSDGFG